MSCPIEYLTVVDCFGRHNYNDCNNYNAFILQLLDSIKIENDVAFYFAYRRITYYYKK